MAMVATLLVCVDLVYPKKTKTSSEVRSGRIDQPGETVTPTVAHRRAA